MRKMVCQGNPKILDRLVELLKVQKLTRQIDSLKCREWGHTAWRCTRWDAPMPIASSANCDKSQICHLSLTTAHLGRMMKHQSHVGFGEHGDPPATSVD